MIHVTQEAAEWFKRELDLKNGQAVRFFARYSSGGNCIRGSRLASESIARYRRP